jgi:hypothetical protein
MYTANNRPYAGRANRYAVLSSRARSPERWRTRSKQTAIGGIAAKGGGRRTSIRQVSALSRGHRRA